MDHSVESGIANRQATGQPIGWGRRLVFVFSVAFSFSALLAVLEAVGHSVVWMILQAPGFVLGEAIWGLDSGGNAAEVLMVVANGVFYSISILIVFAAVRLTRKIRHRAR